MNKLCMVVLAMSAIASGCAADHARRAEAPSQKTCSDRGLQPGTSAYSDCLAQTAGNAADGRRIADPTGKDYEAAKRMRK